ncbi:MAG: phosphoribosyltransferase domain-containing protein [Desulfamplus sp.]|nr:phosphoribosyltransferase domain-containing protein [Desulfamplus sp.]
MLQDFYHLTRDNNPLREEAFTLSCLGKIYPASSSDFLKFRRYLSSLLDEVLSFKDDNCNILVIGLTESGIIPALLMYLETLRRNLNARILYSTRRHLSGIAFKEKHSHGPDHILPVPDCKIREIWIVEDEITSGNTVLNLMIQLCQYLDIERFRVFAFADFRDQTQKSDFAMNAVKHNIECSVHTLDIAKYFIAQEFQSQKKCSKAAYSTVPVQKSQLTNNCSKTAYVPFQELQSNNNCSKAACVPVQMTFTEEMTDARQSEVNNTLISINNISINNIMNTPKTDSLKSWHFPEKRPALAMKSGNFLDSDLWQLSTDIKGTIEIKPSELVKPLESVKTSESLTKGTILAVGEAVDLAACFALANDNIRFQQISLSPWKVDHKSIFSRISFAGKYYLYNYEKLRDPLLHPVFILCDPIDSQIEQEAIMKLGECGIDIKPILKSGSNVESELFQIS